MPSGEQSFTLGDLHFRLEHVRTFQDCEHFIRRLPDSDGQAGEHRRAHRGRLRDLRAADRLAKDIRLELHQVAIRGGAAVGAQLAHRMRRVGFHRNDHVAHLVGDTVERRADDIGAGRAARDSHDRAARVGVPMRRAEPDERRHDVRLRAIFIFRETGARLGIGVGGLAHQLEAVAQPLHGRARDKHRAFERIRRLAGGAERGSREQPILRRHHLVAGVHQQERAGAVGRLRVAGGDTRPVRTARIADRRLSPRLESRAARSFPPPSRPSGRANSRRAAASRAEQSSIASISSSHSRRARLNIIVRDALV